MRIEEIRIEDEPDDDAAIEAFANHWLASNSPPRCHFGVSYVEPNGEMYRVEIESPNTTLGTVDSAEFQRRFESVLDRAFPGKTFVVSGAQPSSEKRSSLRDED